MLYVEVGLYEHFENFNSSFQIGLLKYCFHLFVFLGICLCHGAYVCYYLPPQSEHIFQLVVFSSEFFFTYFGNLWTKMRGLSLDFCFLVKSYVQTNQKVIHI